MASTKRGQNAGAMQVQPSLEDSSVHEPPLINQTTCQDCVQESLQPTTCHDPRDFQTPFRNGSVTSISSASSRKRRRRTADEIQIARQAEEERRSKKLQEKAEKEEQKRRMQLERRNQKEETARQRQAESSQQPRFFWSEEATLDLLHLIQRVRSKYSIHRQNHHGFLPWSRFFKAESHLKVEYASLSDLTFETLDRRYKAIMVVYRTINDKCKQTEGPELDEQCRLHHMSQKIYRGIYESHAGEATTNGRGNHSRENKDAQGTGGVAEDTVEEASREGREEGFTQANGARPPERGAEGADRSMGTTASPSTRTSTDRFSSASTLQQTLSSLLAVQREMYQSQIRFQEGLEERARRLEERAQAREDRAERRANALAMFIIQHINASRPSNASLDPTDTPDLLSHQPPR